ncbi:MAG: hypothetical protein WAS05_04760 [Candidatus Nanopelagicales bacterium]
MKRIFLFGIACSALAALVIIIGDLLNLHLQNVMLGIGGGAILGLVRTHSPAMRYIACLIGFALGLVFYVVRLAVLPATIWGNLVAVVVTLLLVTLIAGLSSDRVPMWGMLLGVTMFAGAFDNYFTTTPWLFVSQAIATAAAMLFAVTAGFMVAVLVELRVYNGVGSGADPMRPSGEKDANADDKASDTDRADSSDQTDTQGLSAVGLSSNSENGEK